MTPQEKEAIQTILNTFPGAQVLSPQAIADEVATWGQAKREAYEERAAIMEHDGGLKKQLAEQLAYVNQGGSMSIVNVKKAAAHAYADRGWPVFPCVPNEKNPLVGGGFKSATTSRAQIEQWWTRWPDANIGIATGQASGLAVVDMDPRNGGAETLAEWTQKHGRTPTLTAMTAGGGAHAYYAMGPEIVGLRGANGFIGDGVDLKADGGYVIAPPSNIGEKKYTWRLSAHDGPIKEVLEAQEAAGYALTPLPRHYLGAANSKKQQQEKPTPTEWSSIVGKAIKEGGRDVTAARIAGAIVSGSSDFEFVQEMLACWNQIRVEPALTAQDIKRIARSIINTHERKQGQR